MAKPITERIDLDPKEKFTPSIYLSAEEKFTDKKIKSTRLSELYALDDGVSDHGFESGKAFVNFLDYSQKLGNCSEWLRYRKFEDGKIKLFDARFCRISTCPLCSWRRSLVWRSQLFGIVPKIYNDFPYHRFILLTLTVKNCELRYLKENVKVLQKGFSNLSKRAFFPFVGGVKSLEVTRQWNFFYKGNFLRSTGLKWYYKQCPVKRKKFTVTPTDFVHPHIHFLGLVPNSYTGANRVSFKEYSRHWKEALRIDYNPVIYVQEVTPRDVEDTKENALFRSVCETLKYTVKDADLVGSFCKDKILNAIFLKELTKQLYKTRKIETFGNFKTYLKDVKEERNEDLIFTESEEDRDLDQYSSEKSIGELLYRWEPRISKYVESVID